MEDGPLSDAAIRPYYERRVPSEQNVADLFRGSWKSQLPHGLVSGTEPRFEDGRPGWATFLAQEGYRVYIVDRPGHGRSPFHPLTHSAFPPTAGPLENISGRFTPTNPTANSKPLPFQHFHNQWVGDGTVGSKDLDQFVASQGGPKVPADASVTSTVGIGPRSAGGFGLEIALDISLPGVPRAEAEALVEKAHQVCPYSNATRGNVDVRLKVV